jgi:hypothetical protein
MPDHRNWLQAEHSDNDALAEALFARLVADLPPVEPRPGFVARAVQVAWQARTRRRRARIATALAIAAGTAALMYELSDVALALLVSGTVSAARGVVWLLTSASDGARWWWIADRIGTTVGDAVADPATASAVAASGVIALLAIYALRHLSRNEWEAREVRRVVGS